MSKAKDTSSEISVGQKIDDFWSETANSNSDWWDKAVRNRGFYDGTQQWEDNDRTYLESKKRPVLTNNRILKRANTISGIERQNRGDLHCFPRKGGNVSVANVWTQLMKQSMDDSRADYVLSQVFMDGIILVKGWCGLDIDYTNDPLRGDIKVVRMSPFRVVEDPYGKDYDIDSVNGCEYIFVLNYFTKDELEVFFPKKYKELELYTSDIKEWDENNAKGVTNYNYPEKILPERSMLDDYDATDERGSERIERRAKFLVKTAYWKTWERRTVAYRATSKRVEIIENEAELAIVKEQKKNMPNSISLREDVVRVLHKTIKCGKVVIDNTKMPAKYSRYPLQRFCPYFVDGKIFGFIDNLIDPQRELNKRRSQALTLLNESVSGAIAYKEGDGLTTKQVQIWKKNMTKAGAMLPYNKEQPQQLRKAELSVGHVTLATLAEDDMNKIEVSDDLMGHVGEKGESGRTIMLRQKQGLTANHVIFDNWANTKEALGVTLLELIVQAKPYSDDEIAHIIDENDLIDKESINQAMQYDAPKLDPQQIMQLPPNVQAQVMQEYMGKVRPLAIKRFMAKLQDWNRAKYGVKVGQATNSETVRMTNYMTMLEIAKMFPGLITPEMILEMSDLPMREKLIDDIKRQREMMMQQQQQGSMSNSPTPQGNAVNNPPPAGGQE